MRRFIHRAVMGGGIGTDVRDMGFCAREMNAQAAFKMVVRDVLDFVGH